MTGITSGYSGFEMSEALLKALRARLSPEEYSAILNFNDVNAICTKVKDQLNVQLVRDAGQDQLKSFDFLGGERPCFTVLYDAGYSNEEKIPGQEHLLYGFRICLSNKFEDATLRLEAGFQRFISDNIDGHYVVSRNNPSELNIFAESPEKLMRFMNSVLDADLKIIRRNFAARDI